MPIYMYPSKKMAQQMSKNIYVLFLFLPRGNIWLALSTGSGVGGCSSEHPLDNSNPRQLCQLSFSIVLYFVFFFVLYFEFCIREQWSQAVMSIVKPQADFNRDSQSSHLAFSQSINVEINIILAWGKLVKFQKMKLPFETLENKRSHTNMAKKESKRKIWWKKGWNEDELFVEISER